MNPSSSSNADRAEGPIFHVLTRALSAGFVMAGDDESSHDLGSLDATQLADTVAKLVALDPDAAPHADPHLVVKTRRGQFAVRPQRGRCLVQAMPDTGQAFVELAPHEVVPYLVGQDSGSGPTAEDGAAPAEPVSGAHTGLAVLGLAVSLLVLAGSAYFSFRSDPADPDSAYAPLAHAESVLVQCVGRFATGTGEGEHVLVIRADDTLSWHEIGPNHTAVDERVETYTVALRAGQPVLRATGLGPIAIHSPAALIFAQQTYTRQP